MLKRIKSPERYRYGCEYNLLVDKYEVLHSTNIKQMQKNVALEQKIDELENLCSFYQHVDKLQRHYYGAV